MFSFLPLRHLLKLRITLAIFLLCLWAFSFYATQLLRRDMERLLGEQQFSTAATVAAQVNYELASRLDTLQRVAALAAPVMTNGQDAVQEFLEQRLDLHVLFNGGNYVAQADGWAIADYPPEARRLGVNYRDREYVSVPLDEGRALIGQPVMGKMAHASVIAMGALIKNAAGKVIGVLTGVINLSMSSFLDQITENTYGRTGGYLLVAPQYRLVVTATDKSRTMEPLPAPGVSPLIDRFIAGYEGSGVVVNPRGIEVLVSAKRIPVSGWYVADG